ncbi:MAG: dihydropteroate synthase [Burkholderiales bacterium]
MTQKLRCGRYTLTLTRPLVMGIVNVTPDSFSDGGKYLFHDQAIEHGLQLIEAGADILDIGGESTRPGAQPLDAAQELQRVLPVIEALAGHGVPLSVDTYKADVMRAALRAGASIINDVMALQGEGALQVAAQSDAAVCLMHMQGNPQTMQLSPAYDDVVGEVRAFLEARLAMAEAAGIARERLVIDPGFGFGKTTEHNLALLRGLPCFCTCGAALLVGLSRKSVLGKVAGGEVEERLPASLAAAVLAALKGANILRVHDVRATREALAVVSRVEGKNA